MRTILAGCAAVVALLSGAAAQQHDDISNPRGVIPNFDVANIGPILTELGAVWQQKKTDGGQPYIAVSVGGDMVLNIVPTACQGANFTHCVGMNTMALFQGGQFNYQTVSAFNQKYWFSTAGVAEDGSAAYISRYEISDYGIARGNVGASVLNLVVLADLFRQELLSSRRTVSMEGYAEDLSSRLLNSRSLKAMGVEDTGQITRHQVAMEETVELVQLLLADKNAPRNKIENITAKP